MATPAPVPSHSPLSADDRVRQAYQGDRGRAYYRLLDADQFAMAVIAEERASKIQPHVHVSDRVLEFGVGNGHNLRCLECAEKWGFDVNVAGAETCREHGVRFVTNLGELDDGHFDAIVCHHVLEHVPDPLATLERIGGLLAPAGTLLLFVPHETRRRYRRYVADDPNHHLFSWNVQSLGNLLDAAGFEIDSIECRAFSYERRLAPLARMGRPLYHAGLAALRRLRPENEVFARAGLPVSDASPRGGTTAPADPDAGALRAAA